ncbi:MAG: RNA-guided endonuclease InsQ/TnpB family protein [Mycobacteriales bacterium]
MEGDTPVSAHLQRKLRRLARLEREKSRRQKGSKNRSKTRHHVAVQHGKVARARRDYHHKQALRLVRENQVIHVEDLNVAGILGNRRLARAIADAGWSQFVRLITEKAERYVRTVHRGPVAAQLEDLLVMRVHPRRAAAEDQAVVGVQPVRPRTTGTATPLSTSSPPDGRRG